MVVVTAAPPEPPLRGGGSMRVHAIGRVRITAAGEELAVTSRKALALVVHLALVDGQQATRDGLSGLLWTDHAHEQARASLRQAVHVVMRALGEPEDPVRLAIGRDFLGLVPRSVDTDLDDVLEAARGGAVHRTLREVPRLADTLLAGLDGLSSGWDAWVAEFRARTFLTLAAALGGMMRNSGASRAARLEAAEALVMLDPTDEEARAMVARLRE